MNILPTAKRAAILGALCEGMSVRATCRLTGTAKGTVLKLLGEIGAACLAYSERTLVNLPCERVQCDEVWSFVGAKNKNTAPELRGTAQRGDAWTWTALCADTKLAVAWHVGPRDADSAASLMDSVAARVANRLQITTDGLAFYRPATERAFGWTGADFAQLVKVYGPSNVPAGKYSPSEFVGATKVPVFGWPDEKHISTSYVERSNLTIRMNIRRFTRLTNAFSKKLENHAHAVSLFMLHYNFCRPHQTLTKAKKGIHTTPAMAAGISDHVWKMEEVVALLASHASN